MRLIFAYFFQVFFKIKYLRKFHFLLYKRIFKPTKLFKGLNLVTTYNKTLKLHVEPEEWIQQHVFLFGTYEINSITCIQNHLQKGGVFFDIGANIGCHSLIAAEKVGENGQIHAFEAISKTYKKLQANIELNGFKNIHTNQVAVYNKSATLDFYIANDDNLGMSSLYQRKDISTNLEQVEAITLDSYVQNNRIEKIDFIKIDIEGAELSAIQGMQETLRHFKPNLLIEISEEIIHETNQSSLGIISLLQQLGYSMYALTESGDLIETQIEISNIHDYFFSIKES
jgi:FkbM family methyltransferase